MKKNNASKAAIGAGGTMTAAGAAMMTNPVTLAPGIALLVGGMVTGFLGSLFHDAPARRRSNDVDDDEKEDRE